MRLPEWFPGVRTRRLHDHAWAAELTRAPDGLTLFQHRAEADVLARVRSFGGTLASRTVESPDATDDEGERWVVLRLSHPALEVWIFADQANISTDSADLRIEQWDASTPEEARLQLASALDSLLHSAPPAA